MSTTVVKGNRVTGTTGTYNPTWPSSAGGAWGAGDWGVVLVGTKPTTAPSIAAFGTGGGTQSIASTNGTPTGAGVGDTCVMARWATLAGTEGGTTVTVTDTDDSVTWAQCYVIHSTVGFDGTVRKAYGSDNVPGVAGAAGGFSAACAGDAGAAWQAGDTLLCAACVPASSPSPMWSAESFTCTGLTFSGVTEQDENASGSGNNICGVVVSGLVATGAASGGPTVTFTATAGSANSYGPALILGFRELAPPGVPTSLVGTPSIYTAELDWSAPVSGGSPSSYEVRIDGGAATDVGLVLTHTFTGLDPLTTYTLEVRAKNASGSSAWASVSVDTLEAPPPGWYRVIIELEGGVGAGGLTYAATTEDAPSRYGVNLPIALGWSITDPAYPAQASLTTLSFKVRVADANDFAGAGFPLANSIDRGSAVTFRMWTDPASDPDVDDPWQTLTGIITQLDGEAVETVPGSGVYDFVVTVYCADDTARLGDMYVGYTADWPIESIFDRVERIATELGITNLDYTGGGSPGTGRQGWLAARTAGVPLSALSALRDTLKDAADDYTSEPPDEFYGRYVFFYTESDTSLRTAVFRRRVFDTTTLDGGLVRAAASWTKQPGPRAASWVIVDDVTFGTPSGVPLVRRTNLIDYTGDPPGSETNWSAIERDTLGESLLPDGSTALDGWGARLLRYEAWLNPDPVTMWASFAPMMVPVPVVVEPVTAQLELNGEPYLAGMLISARLVIPPGGKFYIEFALRSELLPGVTTP